MSDPRKILDDLGDLGELPDPAQFRGEKPNLVEWLSIRSSKTPHLPIVFYVTVKGLFREDLWCREFRGDLEEASSAFADRLAARLGIFVDSRRISL